MRKWILKFFTGFLVVLGTTTGVYAQNSGVETVDYELREGGAGNLWINTPNMYTVTDSAYMYAMNLVGTDFLKGVSFNPSFTLDSLPGYRLEGTITRVFTDTTKYEVEFNLQCDNLRQGNSITFKDSVWTYGAGGEPYVPDKEFASARSNYAGLDSLFLLDFNNARYVVGDKFVVGFTHSRALKSTIEGNLRVTLSQSPKQRRIDGTGVGSDTLATTVGFSTYATNARHDNFILFIDATTPNATTTCQMQIGYQVKINGSAWSGPADESADLADDSTFAIDADITLDRAKTSCLIYTSYPEHADSIRWSFYPVDGKRIVISKIILQSSE